MPQRYDMIVAGGGPAGATAAFFLGQAGKKVLVLEKETFPRYKACGGALSSRVLEQFPFSFEPVIQSRVNAISYVFGEKMVTIPVGDASLCMFMRSEFDAFLLDHARAEVRQGTPVRAVKETAESVTVQTALGEQIEADYLVAADGANSILAHALGLRRRKVMVGAIEVEASVPPETLRRFVNNPVLIIGELDFGYLWVFPKAEALSVGAGGLHVKPGELQSALERVMRRMGISIAGQPRHGHPIPVYDRPEPLGTPRCLLAGDAAGLVDPFTGEGIRPAIQSGRMAAEAILAGQTGRYTARVQHSIGRTLTVARIYRDAFFRLQGTAFKYALRNPAASDGFIRMFEGRNDYVRILFSLAATLPLFLFSERAPWEDPATGPQRNPEGFHS